MNYEWDNEMWDARPELDGWGGMNAEEAAEFVVMNITNGNLLDAIDFLMHEGDVRVDSVVLALRVAEQLCLDRAQPITTVVNQLIRLIDTWETS